MNWICIYYLEEIQFESVKITSQQVVSLSLLKVRNLFGPKLEVSWLAILFIIRGVPSSNIEMGIGFLAKTSLGFFSLCKRVLVEYFTVGDDPIRSVPF
jgi:hypothetical protein